MSPHRVSGRYVVLMALALAFPIVVGGRALFRAAAHTGSVIDVPNDQGCSVRPEWRAWVERTGFDSRSIRNRLGVDCVLVRSAVEVPNDLVVGGLSDIEYPMPCATADYRLTAEPIRVGAFRLVMNCNSIVGDESAPVCRITRSAAAMFATAVGGRLPSTSEWIAAYRQRRYLFRPNAMEVGSRASSVSRLFVPMEWVDVDLAKDGFLLLGRRLHSHASGLHVAMDANTDIGAYGEMVVMHWFEMAYESDIIGFRVALDE